MPVPTVPTPAPTYVWVVAEEGTFDLKAPVPPGASLGTFKELVVYVTADSCRGESVTADGLGWPSWFDKMAALAEIELA